MRIFSRTGLVAAGIAGVLAIGIIGTAGVALADDVPVPGIESLRRGPRDHRLVQVGVRQLVQTSGLEPQVVREGLKNGESLASIFEANGIDTQAVIDEVLADLDAKLDEKVAGGQITAEQAERRYAAAEKALPRLANADHLPRKAVRHFLRHELRIAADTIGIPVQDLVAALRGGETVGEVAEAHGSSADAVIDAMMAPVNERVDAAEASGRIDAEKAATLKTRARERITKIVLEGRPAAPGR